VLFVSTLGVLAVAAAASAAISSAWLPMHRVGAAGAQVTVRNLATGEERFAQADLEGSSGSPASAPAPTW